MSNGHENFILPQKVKEVPSTLYHTSDGDVFVVPCTLYRTSDGNIFVDRRTAKTHQMLIDNEEENGWGNKDHERK